LGYQVQLDCNVARGLLRGPFRKDELHPAHVRYDLEEEYKFKSRHGHTPFASYFDTFSETDGGSIFRSIDRMRIVEQVMSRVFNLEEMVEHGFLNTRYSCHTTAWQQMLASSWATPRLLYSPTVPLNDICNYMGEAVTFRICFLSFITRALLPVVAIAVVTRVTPDWLVPSTLLSMVLCVVLALWGALISTIWAKTEQHWIMAWGMDTIKKRGEAVRPQFNGEWEVSMVDRYTIVKSSPWLQLLYRRTLTNLATCLFNVVLLITVVALFGYRERLLKAGKTWQAHITYWLNAFQMFAFDTVWGYIVIHLTDLDNYETESQYTEKVMQRIFVTRFINSFASLFYISLLKHSLEGCQDGYGCYTELAMQLRVLFGASMVRSVFRAAFSYTWFRATHLAKLSRIRFRQSGYNLVQDSIHQSGLEIQASMPEFSLSEQIEDSMDLIIELGFVLFFGNVAPEIIWLFCASNLIRIRAWGWKLLFAVRRPFPVRSAGLGSLNKVVGYMSACSVWCNILLCLTLREQYKSSKGDVLAWLEQLVRTELESKGASWKSTLAMFLILERALFLARGVIIDGITQSRRPLELEEQRREAMVSAYYKAILEQEQQRQMTETEVEALIPKPQEEGPSTSIPREWLPVGVERILLACRSNSEVHDNTVSPFTMKDPGFESAWGDLDNSMEISMLDLLGSERCDCAQES